MNFCYTKFSCIQQTGLLAGANDTFFTTNLNLLSASQLVENSDAIFRMAIEKDSLTGGKDTQLYLSEIKKKASQYLREGDICGRVNIRDDIKKAMLQKGSLTFISGGYSVGKSKIMASIAQAIREDQLAGDSKKPPQAHVSATLVDGREQEVILSLSKVATGQAAEMMEKDAQVMLNLTFSTPVFVLALQKIIGLDAQVTSTLTFSAPAGVTVVSDFKDASFALSEEEGAADALDNKHPQNTNHTVLILDEANVHLGCTRKGADAQRAKDLFNVVVMYTRQLKKMSVVLVSWDGGLPNRLLDVGLDPDQIQNTFVISEPTPRECLDLLSNKLGVGEHLSSALLDSYGGDVYRMCVLLEDLPSEYACTESRINVFKGPASDVSSAVYAWVAEGGDEAVIWKVLEQLARTGFVPMSASDKLARMLTKSNVCAYLTKDAVEYQVPEELRAKKAGLIPSSQLMRVLIAWNLVGIENQKNKAGK